MVASTGTVKVVSASPRFAPPRPLRFVVKDVERRGHLQYFLDAVLYADNAPRRIKAVGSRAGSACLTPIYIVFPSRSFSKL